MALVALTLVGGLLTGWVRGGRVRTIGSTRLAGVSLIVVAVVAQVALAVSDVARAPLTVGLLAGSQLAVLGFLVANRLLPGVTLIGIGSVANAVVVIANGGMPVSGDALSRIARHPLELTPGKHRLLEAGDALPWLADVVALPALGQIVSVGDVFIAAGVGVMVAGLMRGGPVAAAAGGR